MSIDVAVVRSRIRVESGNPSTEEIADSSIDKFVEDGFDEVSKEVSNWAIFSVTSVKDQPDYTVDSAAIDVLFCDWNGEGHLLSDLFDVDFKYVIPGFEGGYDVETGQYKEVVAALEKAKISNRYDWMFREYDRKLVLIPPPSSAGQKIYYIGKKTWALASCPSRFERYFVWYGTAQTLKAVARKRRRLSAVGHTGGPIVWAEADPTLADAKALEDRFYEAIRVEGRLSLF